MKKIKVHSLTGRITPTLMQQAFRAVKRNRGAAGVDKVSINMFEANREENLAALMRDLKGRTFQPRPLRRVYIPKGPGSTKLRPLGIPVVRDRIAQEVIRRLLAPIFEPLFHDNSYGFISGRNAHQAIERVLELHRQGYRTVLEADMEDRSEIQFGLERCREAEPGDQGHGELFRHRLLDLPLEIPEA